MRMFWTVFLVLAVALGGCASPGATTPQPRLVVALQGAQAGSELQFSDKDIEISFRPSMQQLGFALRNRSSGPVKIDWNAVSFVDFNKDSRRVIHEGVKLIDRNNMLAPSIVPPGANFSDFVYPSDLVFFTSGRYGGWTQLPMFSSKDAASRVGQTFSVFMPLEVDGKTKNYNFVFVVTGVVN